ncbi:MAG: FAD-dependent oxidoreductase [Bdellovibrio sp.]|nr:FAD-dependent oxidoreductase [Bdellovibrio sp.]
MKNSKTIQLSVLSFFLFSAVAIFGPGNSLAANYKIAIRGGDDLTFSPKPGPRQTPIGDKTKYDVVVIGGGLAGLSSAIFLSEKGKKILIIEKEAKLGGLAAGDIDKKGIRYNRGAAYWADAGQEIINILEHIGLTDFKKNYPIHDPIDSYLWKGKFYEHFWEHPTIEELPVSFALFKHELEMSEKDGLIPGQPFEEADNLELDKFTAEQWLKTVPDRVAARKDEESKKIYERFKKDPRVDQKDPMKDVSHLVELYTRSALGGLPNQVSAAAFANFYVAEFVTRYTSPNGTGEASMKMIQTLKSKPKLVSFKTQSTATKIINETNGVRVQFINSGKLHEVAADYAVFAAQLRFAPRIIEGLTEKSPEQAAAMNGLEYSHCFVHVVRVKGHPYRASYDTWVRPEDYKDTDFTDVILGRWMDPKIKGYADMRDFKKHPSDNFGIFTIYHNFQHPSDWMKDREQMIPEDHFKTAAKMAVDGLLKNLSPLLKEKWGTKIEVESVETNRWPYSLMVVTPGHFTKLAKIMRKPFGKVFFANNNLGTPSVEEAVFRGHCAANNILKRVDSSFKNEEWSNCPIENP